MGLCFPITTDISRAGGPAQPCAEAVGTIYVVDKSPLSGKGDALPIWCPDPDFQRTNGPTKKTTVDRTAPSVGFAAGARCSSRAGYIRSIIAFPNPEHETCVDPDISRAKS